MNNENETPTITFSNEKQLALLYSFTIYGIFLYENFLIIAKDQSCPKDFIDKIKNNINEAKNIQLALSIKLDRFHLVR